MKTILSIWVMLSLAALALAQQTPAAPAAAGVNVPDGTVFLVELKSKLDSKKLRVGDPVKLEVVEDAKGSDGKVVAPKGSKLTGQITETDASTKESPNAKLSFVVTSGDAKGKPLTMTAYMIPPFKAPAPMQAIDKSMIDSARTHSDTGYQTAEDPTAGKGPKVDAGGSGLEGIKLKLDLKLGTYLEADKKNVVLESGTMFHVKQATLQPQGAATPAPKASAPAPTASAPAPAPPTQK